MDGTADGTTQGRRSTHLAKTTRQRFGLGVGAFATVLAIAGASMAVTSASSEVNTVASGGIATDQADDWAALVDPWLQEFLGDDFGGFEDWGYGGGYDTGVPTPGQGGGGQVAQEAAEVANATESSGVVIIDTELSYSGGEAAGSGMILTSDGLVLTNAHVISGSTAIAVTDPSTGTTYSATLVGSDVTKDVALLQLEDASGLTTIAIDQDDTEAIGDTITAVGNASGGGVLMAADGTITGLDATVTTGSDAYSQGETLTGTIQISADVVSGDSGGALLDEDGEVIGMNSAASSGTTVITAYAITIEDALAIVEQILAGDESGTVTLGYPAFLGIGLTSTANSWSQATTEGATVGYVYAGTPAEDAGLEAGDTITKVAGEAVTSATIASVLSNYDPGDEVTITWTDAEGKTHSQTVTLTQGPAA